MKPFFSDNKGDRRLLELLGLFAGMFVMMLLANFLSGYFLKAFPEWQFALSNCLAFVFIVGFFIAIRISGQSALLSSLNRKNCRGLYVFYFGSIGAIVATPVIWIITFLWNLVLELLNHSLPQYILESIHFEIKTQEAVNIVGQSDSVGVRLITAFTVLILAPIAEEIFFRGCVYRTIRSFAGTGVSMALCGLVFGLVHFNWVAFVPLFFFGAFLAYLYEKSGDIRVPILTHAIYNGIVLVSTIFMTSPYETI